ncbi:MAG: hypothetical protein GKR95_05545 [Gammaproteobacteria bacterium]|nr:hypothetical protein [Gammaproteobacteria bacterium]
MFFPSLNSVALSRLAFLLVFVLANAKAESVIGTVSFSTGDVTIEMEGTSRIARTGGLIYEQDKVVAQMVTSCSR